MSWGIYNWQGGVDRNARRGRTGFPDKYLQALKTAFDHLRGNQLVDVYDFHLVCGGLRQHLLATTGSSISVDDPVRRPDPVDRAEPRNLWDPHIP